jgi:DNA-binding transcriptional ArsR family regulator
MREFLAVMKAFADENRLRIMLALQNRELCLCQIVELLGLANSTVSRHMSILYQARLVDVRKDGRWSYFRLAETQYVEATEVLGTAVRALSRDPIVKSDKKRLKEILKVDPEKLCRRQSDVRC